MCEARIREFIFEGSHPETFPTHTSASRITSLDHEVADDTVEYDAIIVSLLYESDEVLDCLRCCFWKEFEYDITMIRRKLYFWIGHRKRVIEKRTEKIDGRKYSKTRSSRQKNFFERNLLIV